MEREEYMTLIFGKIVKLGSIKGKDSGQGIDKNRKKCRLRG
jgi:hypothetical protein